MAGKRLLGKGMEQLKIYQVLLQSAGDALFVHDLTGRILDVNQQACDMTGYARDELLSLSVPDIEQVHDGKDLAKLWGEIGCESARTIAGLHKHKEGAVIPVEIRLGAFQQNGKKFFLALVRDLSEQLRTIQDLRETEAQIQSIFRAAPVGIGVVADRVFIQVNDRLCEMLGYNREELLGQSARMIYPSEEEFLRVGIEKFAQIKAKGIGTIETLWQRKDGRVFNVLLSSAPLDPSDHSTGMTFTALDITERKHAEDMLRKAEEKYRALVERVPVVFYMDAPDEVSTTIYMSPQVEALVGYTPEEWLEDGDLWPFVLHPEDFERVMQENLRTNKTYDRFQIEYRMIAKDGRVVWVRDEAVLEFDTEGKPAYWSGVLWDITERKHIEENLRLSENKFSRAFHTSPDAVNINRLIDGIYIDINEGFTSLTGYTQEDVIGKSSLEINIWANPQDRAILVKGLLENGVVKDFEAEFRMKSGVIKTGLMSATVLEIGGEKCILSMTRDISERKLREKELEAISTVSAALRNAPTTTEMLPVILDQVNQLLNISASAIALTTSREQETVISDTRGAWKNLRGMVVNAKSQIMKDVMVHHKSSIVNDLDIAAPFNQASTENQIKGVVCIPMISQDNLVGWIAAGFENTLSRQDLQLLHAITDIAATAIQRASLHEQTERRMRRLDSLRVIDRSINASLDLRFTMSILLSQVVHQLEVDAADVLLFNRYSNLLKVVGSHGFRQPIVDGHYRTGGDPAGQAVMERRTITIPDLQAASPNFRLPSRLCGEMFTSYFAVPLISKGQVNGVLEIFTRLAHQADDEWFSFLESLAEQAAIAMDNAALFTNLQRSNVELRTAYDATIEGWSRALDLRDRETEGHTQRVTEATLRLAQAMGIPEPELIHIHRGSLLHDIGKMGIPDHILNKPGSLTDSEWEIMRKHPDYAYELLAPIAYLRDALDIPYCHHEKWDGSGYPRKLTTDQIPLAARVFAVIDVWDALRSERPYRSAWPENKVHEYIRSAAGTHFDPKVVETFFRVIDTS